MGLFSGLLGNASQADVDAISQELEHILIPNEQIDCAYQLIRDYFVFTNKRLIMVDKQGITGKKKEFHSIPYKSVTHFSVETNGHFDLESELIIWISSTHEPIQKQLKKSAAIFDIQTALARHVLG